jgi:hypothetical protein
MLAYSLKAQNRAVDARLSSPIVFHRIERESSTHLRIERVAAPPTLPIPCKAPVDAPAPLRLWHLTSLDAPTVAVVWSLAFAWAAGVALPSWLPAVLALAGWSFYILDRLFDARRCLVRRESVRFADSSASLLRPRHYFHWKYRRIFAPIAVLAAGAAIGLVARSMPAGARGRNALLAAAAIAYFSSVHSPWRVPSRKVRLPKELLVGILFTLACATPAWSRMSSDQVVFALPVLIFMTLAWLNCAAIERWESGELPCASISRAALALASAAMAAGLICGALGSLRIELLLGAAALSAGLLALLDRIGNRLTATTLRSAADLVLLTPLVLLLR